MRFADTSFWVALASARDDRHAEARALAEAGLGPVVTTNHVLGETWTFTRRRHGLAGARRCVDAIRRLPDVAVHHVDEHAEADAWRWLARRDEREYSFVDATSFAVMRRMRIREALAFDGDFAAAGFTEARP